MKDKFDWTEFLSIAEEIFQKVSKISQVDLSEEAVCRTAISRAYYFAFHVSQMCLIEINPDFRSFYGAGSHNDVINGLKNLKEIRYRKIANYLEKFKIMRVKADYDSERYPKRFEIGNIVAELQKAIDYAKKIKFLLQIDS